MFDVLSHFMLFCCKSSPLCDLRCFVAKSVLSRFTRFGVEKNWANNFVCGEKRTNIRYGNDVPVLIALKKSLSFDGSLLALRPLKSGNEAG